MPKSTYEVGKVSKDFHAYILGQGMGVLYDTSDMDQVLFVDSNADTLNEILMEVSVCGFDMFMGEGYEQGMQVMRNHAIDMVVASVGLKDQAGIDFLTQLKEEYPNTHRVVLTGAADDAATTFIARGYATAHIARPWKEDGLRKSVEHILKVRKVLKQEKLLESINEIDQLPSLPTIYQDFNEAILNEESIKTVAEILEGDVSLSARLLQIANSAFYGSSGIFSVEQAVIRLGINTVKDLVMTFSFVSNLNWTEEQTEKLQSIFTHCSMVNKYLKSVYKIKYGVPLSPSQGCLGITHDIGKIIILQYFPDRFDTILERQGALSGATFFDSEEDLGFSWFKHAEVGAYFLNMWNLPDPVVEATLFHHDPDSAAEENQPVIQVLAYVDNLVSQVELLTEEEDWESVRVEEDFIPIEELNQVLADLYSELKVQPQVT